MSSDDLVAPSRSSSDKQSDRKTDKDSRHSRHKKDHKSKRRRSHSSKRRKRNYSSDSDSSSDSSEDSRDRREQKRRRKKHKTKKSKEKRKRRDDGSSEEDEGPSDKTKAAIGAMEQSTSIMASTSQDSNSQPPSESLDNMQQRQQARQRMAPMTREQYQSKRAEIRQEFDPESGRYRLVRGTGELLEQIVSRDQHLAINRQATRGDGESFVRNLYRSK